MAVAKAGRGGRGRKRGAMSAAQRESMAESRHESSVVKAYLESLESRPTGRDQLSVAAVDARLAKIEADLEGADVLSKLELFQRRSDLLARRKSLGGGVDEAALEAEFIKVAESFATKRSVGYAAFRAMGVPPRVLREAGVKRGTT